MYSFTPVESSIVKDEVKDTVASAGAGFPAPSSSGHLTDTNTGPMVNEQNDQQGSQGKAPSDHPVTSPAAATAAPSMDKKAGKPSEHNICQVPGCGADLRSNKEYYQRYRICLPHFHIEEMLVDGVPQRFCQQCGRFHLLNRFDGKKRSCREKLAYHNARRRKHNTSDYGTSTPTSSIAGLPNCTRSLTSGSLRSDTIRGSHFSQMGQDVPILATCATSAKKRFRMSLDNQLQQQHDFAQEDALGNFRLQLQLAQAQQDMQHQAAHQHLFSSLRGMSGSAMGSALPTPRSQLHDSSMHSGKPPLVATTYNPRLTAASSAPLPRPAGAGPMPLDLVDCMLLEDMSLCNILLSGSDRDTMHYERDSYSGNMIRAASMSANNLHGALSLSGPNRGSIPSHGTATIMTRANDAISSDGYGPYTAAYASLSGWATPSDVHVGQPASASELRPMVEALPRGTTFTLHQPINHKQHTIDGRNLAGDVSIGILFEEINQASGPGWWRQREVEEEQRPRW